MRKIFRITLLILLPLTLFAQGNSALKTQADLVAQAVVSGNYSTVIDYMYPKVIQMSGGKAKLLQMMTTGINQMKTQGVSFINASVGTPGKFYKAGTEIHCLVPEIINMKTPGGTFAVHSNLLAISKDKGKNWTFLDLNKNTIAQIPKLFPNFNKELVIPEPSMPAMQ
ncbi:hypothetical protein A0256_21235 [Mucilaginibacter sp. PAMC 26640]|nr:hypothetical protein A0256_21235 [Mucilaginibacter sp. PAMC 26640]